MYNYSARRKQGLGSLRPGYFSGGDVLLGNLMNWGIGKATSKMFGTQETAEEKLNKQMSKFIYGYGNEKDDDDTSQGFTSTPSAKSRIGGGILNALATMILGPVMGPIALAVGRGLKNKYTGGDGGSGVGPKGPKGPGPKTDWYTGSDEEDKDNEWDPSAPTTSVPSHIGPTGHDIHGNGDSGGRGTSSGSQNQTGHGSSGMGRDPSDRMATGGRVSYSQGGIASLWQR